jgi:hypothetical protein
LEICIILVRLMLVSKSAAMEALIRFAISTWNHTTFQQLERDIDSCDVRNIACSSTKIRTVHRAVRLSADFKLAPQYVTYRTEEKLLMVTRQIRLVMTTFHRIYLSWYAEFSCNPIKGILDSPIYPTSLPKRTELQESEIMRNQVTR